MNERFHSSGSLVMVMNDTIKNFVSIVAFGTATCGFALEYSVTSDPQSTTGLRELTVQLPRFSADPRCVLDQVVITYDASHTTTAGITHYGASPLSSYGMNVRPVGLTTLYVGPAISSSFGPGTHFLVDSATYGTLAAGFPGGTVSVTSSSLIALPTVTLSSPSEVSEFISGNPYVNYRGDFGLNFNPGLDHNDRLSYSLQHTFSVTTTFKYHCIPDSNSVQYGLLPGLVALASLAVRKTSKA